MADRTVSVELQLKTEQYKTEAEAAKVKTEELDKKVEALDRDVNKIPADAAKAAVALGAMGAEANKAGDDTGKLDARIEELKDSIKSLGAEFDRTGDPELLKKFRADSSELAGLTRMRSEVEKLASETPVATKAFGDLRGRMDELEASLKTTGAEFARNASPELLKKFRADSSELNGLKSTVAQMEKLGVDVEQLGLKSTEAAPGIGALFGGGGIMGFLTSPIGAPVAGATAIVAGAGLGGAATLAAGGGAAGLGVFGAAMGDPAEFKQAWDPVVADLKGELIDAGQAFRGPALAAVDSLDRMVKNLHIADVIAPAAAFVQPLADAAEGFLLNVDAGVKDLVADAGPVIQEFSKDLPELGKDLGGALHDIGANAQGGADGLHAMLKAVGEIITLTGQTVGAFEAITGGIHDASQAGMDFFDSIPTWVRVALPWLELWKLYFDNVTDSTRHGMDAVGPFGHALGDVAANARNFQQAGTAAMDEMYQRTLDVAKVFERLEKDFDDATSKVLGLRDAQVAAAQAMADLVKGFKKGADALDVNSQKGRDNITLIDKTIAGYIKQRDEAIAAGGGTADAYAKANQTYQQQLANLDQVLAKLLGSKKAADEFLAAFKDKTITIDVIVNEFHRGGTADIGGHTVLFGSPEGAEHHFNQKATGGPAAGLTLVGEQGPELVDLPAGSFVHNADQTRAMMARSGAPSLSGSMSVAVTLAASPGGNLTPLASLVNQMIRDGLIVVPASKVRVGV